MFYFGVDYYPEHWSETRWETDAKLMQESGFNTVRLAEFAWSLLEPEDGIFDFDWLDRAINVLADYGMKVVLGTPSAAVPPWRCCRRIDRGRLLREDGIKIERYPDDFASTIYIRYTRRNLPCGKSDLSSGQSLYANA